MSQSPERFELLQPAPPGDLLPAIGMWPWLLAAALLVLATAAAAISIALRRRVLPDPHAHRAAAREKALASLEQCAPADPRDAAIRCSLILRTYLAEACEEPALFETHEEFTARHNALSDLSQDARNSAAAFFSRLARLKYAAETPDGSPENILSDSRELLETLHQAFTR